ncbi:MAG: hypothetical protein KF774_18935 [Planctomyces sp.]|nr:hypothetical protein [Planctomyces sp.]
MFRRHRLLSSPVPCRLLPGMAALLASSGLVLTAASAAERAGGTTVFLGEDGSAWTVVVRPKAAPASEDAGRVEVPAPPEPTSLTPEPPAEACVVPVSAVAFQDDAESPGDEEVDASLALPPSPSLGPAAEETFGIAITPGGPRKLRPAGRSYEDAYRSIPFNRAEYIANPSYRHDSAMELLFGELRPTTIVRQGSEGGVAPRSEPFLPPLPYRMTPSEAWAYPRSWPAFAPSMPFGMTPSEAWAYPRSWSAFPAFGLGEWVVP